MTLDAYSVDDVRAAENAALKTTAEGALMQHAAAALAASCARVLHRTGSRRVTGRRVVLLVGAGNNGGDALWAGARLAARGAQVTAVSTSAQVHPAGLAALRAAGGVLISGVDPEQDAESDAESDTGADSVGDSEADSEGLVAKVTGTATRRTAGAATGTAAAGVAVVRRAELVVDGLVGLGARAPLREPAATLVAAIGANASVVAVDLPSGVDPDTGELPGPHVRADVTVTFGAAKPCLLLPPGSMAAGSVELVDLGFGAGAGAGVGAGAGAGSGFPGEPLVQRLTGDDVARLWPVPEPGADKYRRGVLGVVAGSAGYPGAAVLAVSGALRAGLGMVRYLGPADATAAVRTAWPEVVAGDGRVQAWLLGSGVVPDADDGQPAAIRKALAGGLPCLLDAGALGVLIDELREHLDRTGAVPDRTGRLLLTPHAGELARLLTDLSDGGAGAAVGKEIREQSGKLTERADVRKTEREDVERQPYRHARRAAELTGATVLLKGATTLVVRPDGRARSQADATSWLATAGAGDVLAGIAGALLAGGLTPFDAGSVAALVHGRAARAASAGGPIVSADVAQHTPATIAALLTPPHP